MDYKLGIEILDKLLDKNYKYKNVDDVYVDLRNIKELLKTTRNELCLFCGKYKNEHQGWCKDCRFRG